jgi:hypothetical protein
MLTICSDYHVFFFSLLSVAFELLKWWFVIIILYVRNGIFVALSWFCSKYSMQLHIITALASPWASYLEKCWDTQQGQSYSISTGQVSTTRLILHIFLYFSLQSFWHFVSSCRWSLLLDKLVLLITLFFIEVFRYERWQRWHVSLQSQARYSLLN